MGLDRRLRNMEPFADLGIAQPLAHEGQDGFLPPGQGIIGARRRPHNGCGTAGLFHWRGRELWSIRTRTCGRISTRIEMGQNGTCDGRIQPGPARRR